VPVPSAAFTDPELLDLLDEADVAVPRGEPRRQLADVARALVARDPVSELHEKLAAAAEALWDDEAQTRVERALAARGSDDVSGRLALAPGESPLALASAYRAALPYVARDEHVRAPLDRLEPTLAGFDEEDRDRFGPVLARAAVPALAVDVELMKDEGYRYVAVYPPEGSEGVDVVGRAAAWLTRRMTVDGDAPRHAMRRFLALLAEEVEVDLPVTAATLDRLVAEPMPPTPAQDRLFVALARGLVEEAMAERGPPY
jgi:hypothetical protein